MLAIQAIYWQTKKTMHQTQQGCQQQPCPDIDGIQFLNFGMQCGRNKSILPNSITWHIIFTKLNKIFTKMFAEKAILVKIHYKTSI